MKSFAVFDIDGTLIRWQLYHAIVNELAKQGHLTPGAYERIHASRMIWKKREGGESFKAYERELIHTYHQALRGLPVEAYLQAIDTIFEEYKDQVFTYTRDLLKSLKQRGYVLFAISGSQMEILEKLAAYYGFDEAVGSIYEREGDHFTGKSSTVVEHKGEVLDKLIKQYDVGRKGSIAVGDSASDAALLELVEQPIAFNPDKTLFALAKKHGWKVVLERKNMVYKLEPHDGHYLLA